MTGRGKTGTGLGKGGAKRHRKVIFDSIQGLKSYMRRMANSIKEKDGLNFRVGDPTLRLIPDLLHQDFKRRLVRTLAYTTHDRRKTVLERDVEAGFGKMILTDEPVMAKESFKRYIKEIAQDHENDIRYSEEAKRIIQIAYEASVRALIMSAATYARSIGQQTILPSGLETVLSLKKEICK